MKSNLRKMLWAAIAMSVAGIVAAGVLRAQQPPVAAQQPVLPPVAAQPPRGGVFATFNQNALQPGQVIQMVIAEDGDPELNELRQSAAAMSNLADGLAAQYAATEDVEKRSAIKAELLESLTRQFEAQQKVRERELANVEARVKKLRDLTQKRRDAQKTIIDQRLDQLLREADGLGWAPPANAYDAVAAPQSNKNPNGRAFIKVSDDLAPRR